VLDAPRIGVAELGLVQLLVLVRKGIKENEKKGEGMKGKRLMHNSCVTIVQEPRDME
jgi:hypothetical protein